MKKEKQKQIVNKKSFKKIPIILIEVYFENQSN